MERRLIIRLNFLDITSLVHSISESVNATCLS